MPGSVLETGDTFSFSGAMWPTLPSLSEVTVTIPSGETITSTARANKIGYLYNPADDFVLTEPGKYTVKVTVTHDGMTSARPVEEPFPTGDVLGSDSGTYVFYVVPKGSSNFLLLDTARTGAKLGSTLAISSPLPSGLTEVKAHYTTNLTGTVLESGTLSTSGGSVRYTYDLLALNGLFPNLDSNPGDTVVVTLAVTGKDAAGQPTAYASQVLLQGADIYALAEE